MNQFDIKKSVNYSAYRLRKFCGSWFGKVLIILFNLIGLVGLGLLIYLVFNYQPLVLDWALRAGAAYLAFKIFHIFYLDYLLGPKLKVDQALKFVNSGKEFNLADGLDPCLLGVFEQEKYLAKDIALGLIELDELNFVLNRAGISRDEIRRRIEENINGEQVGSREEVVIKAFQVAKAEGHGDVGPGDLFIALTMIEPALKRLVDELGLRLEDLLNIVYWYNLVKRKNFNFLDTSDFIFNGGVGKDWIFGYTRYLNRYSQDITDLIRQNRNNLKYIGHQSVIDKIEKSLLSSQGKNMVLVGSEGSGKRTSVYGLARRIALGQAYGAINLKRVLELDLEALLSGATSRGEIVGRLNRVFGEAARVGNLVLLIDNFDNILSTKALGQVDASQILIPYLSSPEFNVIGTSQPGPYHRYVENNPALDQRIEKIEIEEPGEQEMIRILEDSVPLLEARTGCFFRYLAIKEVLFLANKYVFNQPNPQKSLKLLDKVASESRGQIVTRERVREIASSAYKVPVGEAGQREKRRLLNLEEILHRRVINQNQAIEEIAQAMRRARAEIGQKGKKPIGSFLFIGPTGVGKTETAKALASSYFSGEENMARFDMGEYQNKQDLYRLIGDSQEGGRPGELSRKLNESPHSLLLFDEVEKAHPDILNLFLQILDEGVATTSQGKKLVFSNTIIIATSNAGAEYIRKKIEEGVNPAEISDEIQDYLMDKGIFKPEFLNRFSSVVSFSPLTRAQIEKIAKIKLDKLKRQIKSEKDIQINFGENVASEIASRGYNPEMGARPMERTIERLIENLIAKKILANDLKRGESLTIKVEDFEN